jgi:hypothetical protein
MPEGFSLHVGLDRLDVNTFPHFQAITGCAAAAGLMSQIAKSKGFAPTVYQDEGATYQNVSNWWTEASTNARAGDFVFFSFAGHGDSVHITSSQPLAQTLVLHDREVSDQEFIDLLSDFSPGVRIVIVADSCFSGGLVTGQAILMRGLRARRLSRFGGQSLQAIANSKRKTARVVKSRASDVRQVAADVLLFAASPQDVQTPAASQGQPFSPFSKAFSDVWTAHSGNFAGGYLELFADVKAQSPNNEPVLVQDLVKTKAFLTEAPFSIQG